jgi:hypothetical protein
MFPLLSKMLLPPLLGLTLDGFLSPNLKELNDIALIPWIPLEEDFLEFNDFHVPENKIQPPINKTEISHNYHLK